MTTTFINKVREAYEAGSIPADGHTIFNANAYEPYFTAEELREAGLVQTHKSDISDPKTTIFNENGIVEELKDSVYNLEFLYWVHRKLGITKDITKIGRGSQAQQICEHILEVIAEVK